MKCINYIVNVCVKLLKCSFLYDTCTMLYDACTIFYPVFGPIANLNGLIFIRVCLSVCVCLCVSDWHFYHSTLTDFDETWSQGPYCSPGAQALNPALFDIVFFSVDYNGIGPK